MKFNFNVEADLLIGIDRLKSVLGFESGNGITVTAVKSDKLGVTLKNNEAVIYYTQKAFFYRMLGILVNNAKTKTEFEHFDDTFFETMSVMIDTSRCGVPSVKTINKMVDYLAVMGYNMVMLYTEDTIELKNRPYFGYMRGRYTADELKTVDDYAFDYGIEVIPCLECYGHMEKYLIWPEAASIKDTAGVLLAREEKTFEFLDELISTVSSCFRSKRINIGMDEAWDMGRGAFLNKHGYVPPFEIFTEFMERLCQITDKYGLTPMMWSDMYFRTSSKNGRAYYSEDIEIPESVAKQIPKNVELVFWHYGEAPYCDDFMLKKHKALNRKTIYAGGLWGWVGHFPEHNYAMDAINFSLNACRNNDVREAMITIWTNDNNENELFTNLFGLSYFIEKCFDNNASEQKLRERFEAATGGNYDAFYEMCMYHNNFDAIKEFPNFHDRFLGKHLFWQDIMEGLYDTHLFKQSMSGHYAAYAKKMNDYTGKWEYLYKFASKVFDYLAIKTLIAENLVFAYKAGDKAKLSEISEVLLPALREKTVALHNAHKTIWFDEYKIVGWSNLDVRYAGVVARCDTAKMLIDAYLDGKTDTIEELEVERLDKVVRGFTSYSQIATPNIRI